jgi:hypothetical protein
MPEVPNTITTTTPSYPSKTTRAPFLSQRRKKVEPEYTTSAPEQPPIQEEYLPSVPTLVNPSSLRRKKRPSVEYEAILDTQSSWNTHAEELLFDKLHLQTSSKQVLKLHGEFLEELRKQGLEAEKSGNWKGLTELAQHVTSIISFAVGMFALTQGQTEVAAKMILFAAGSGLFTKIMKDTGGFEKLASYVSKSEENKKKTAESLETYFVYLSLGIGLFQLTSNFSNGMDVLARIPDTDKLRFVQSSLTSAGVAANSLGNGMQFYHTANIHKHAELAKAHEAKKTSVENSASRITSGIGMKIKTQEDLIQILKTILNAKPIITR